MSTFDLRCTRADLLRVMEGHPVTLENHIRLRLYTAAEFQAAVRASQDKVGMPEADRVPLSGEQLAALTHD